MKILLYSGYSNTTQKLYEITHPNHLLYAQRHGYDCLADKVPWEEWKLEGLLRLREKLQFYDSVLMHGMDILFMNHDLFVEDQLRRRDGDSPTWDGVVLSKENIGWWPINNDVMIWRNKKPALWLLDLLIERAPIWKEFPWLWQNDLWNLMQVDPMVRDCVLLREARAMNSTHQPCDGYGKRFPGPSSWQLGDWIIHFLDMPLESKIQAAKTYLPFVGNGTYHPHP